MEVVLELETAKKGQGACKKLDLFLSLFLSFLFSLSLSLYLSLSPLE